MGPGEERRAVRREVRGALLHGLAGLVHQLLEPRGIGDDGLPAPPDGDGLQVLGAPHGPDAPAAGDALAVLPVVGEAREAHAVLAGGADGEHVGLGAVGGLDRLHRVAGGLPPDAAGVPDGRPLLVHREVDRMLGAPGHHDGVEAGALERGREPAAERRVEEQAGLGRLGGDARAAVAGHEGVGDRTHREGDGVRGIEGVGPRHGAASHRRRAASPFPPRKARAVRSSSGRTSVRPLVRST